MLMWEEKFQRNRLLMFFNTPFKKEPSCGKLLTYELDY